MIVFETRWISISHYHQIEVCLLPLFLKKRLAIEKLKTFNSFQIEDDNPYLLIPYFYHLYMGLLSGGQILSKKRSVFGSGLKAGSPGNATVEFGPELPIGTLKKKIKEATNRVAEDLDESTRKAILVTFVGRPLK